MAARPGLGGRGWALSQAVTALPSYWDTNPGMVRQATRALAQVMFGRSHWLTWG